jgi:hypothetical protein
MGILRFLTLVFRRVHGANFVADLVSRDRARPV